MPYIEQSIADLVSKIEPTLDRIITKVRNDPHFDEVKQRALAAFLKDLKDKIRQVLEKNYGEDFHLAKSKGNSRRVTPVGSNEYGDPVGTKYHNPDGTHTEAYYAYQERIKNNSQE